MQRITRTVGGATRIELVAILGALLATVTILISGFAAGLPAAASPPSHSLGPNTNTCVSPGVTCTVHATPGSGSHGASIRVKVILFYPNDFFTAKLWNGKSGANGLWQTVASGPTASGAGAGDFTTHFMVPKDPVGAYTLFVSDTTGDNASTAFHITKLGVSPSSGSPSSNSVVTGSGFRPSVTVTLSMGGAVLGTVGGCSTDSTGKIIQDGSCVLYVPNLAAGTYTLKATDGKYVASTRFTVT